MRILYVCHDLDYWAAHRAGLAAAMVGQGDEVALLCGVPRGHGGIRQLGDRALAGSLVPGGAVWTAPIERQRLQPAGDLAFAAAVRSVTRRVRPDVVHLITLKPVLFGAAALRLTGLPLRIVATFPGLGRVFAADPPDRRQRLILRGLRLALGGPRTTAVFENAADRERLVAAGVVPPARAALVRGAGFDPAEFPPAPLPPGPAADAPLHCLFASRMLRAKGAGAVIDAARRLAAEGAPVRITLAGASGADADALPPAQLQQLASEGIITYLGPVPPSDMAALIARHHVLLLPTRYPEGTPRILAEAGAVGRPTIVSAHPGCTAFVRDGVEGIVIDPPDAWHLAAAIRSLTPEALAAMGAAAQRRALQDGFTTEAVACRYRALYRGEALADPA